MCVVRCKDSWDANKHPHFTIDDLTTTVLKTPAELVVITGGEPLMHNLDNLTSALQAAGLKTNIETSGAHPLSGSWDWICLSLKIQSSVGGSNSFCPRIKNSGL